VVDVQRLIRDRLAEIDDLGEGDSRYGHTLAFWANGKEIAHFEAASVIDIRLTRAVIRDLRASFKTDDRVLLRPSGADWITVHFRTAADVDFVVGLVRRAADAHRPPDADTVRSSR
jgi:hypothetical protein